MYLILKNVKRQFLILGQNRIFLQPQIVMKGAEFYRAGQGEDAVNGGAERLMQPVGFYGNGSCKGFLSVLYSVCFLADESDHAPD